MKTHFRLVVAIALAFHAVGLFVLPRVPFLFSTDTMELMRYAGHGALINPTHPITYVQYLLPYPALIAIYFFRNWGRYLFLVFLLVTLLGTFFLGISIAGPPGTFIGYAGTLLDGAIVGLMFLSPVKEYFSKRSQSQ